MQISDKNKFLQNKYNITAWFYDILDLPWEIQYKRWRPEILKDLRGAVLEAGVGTGHNLKHYHRDVDLTGIELSAAMLKIAEKRAKSAACHVKLVQEDATSMESISTSHYDWVIGTFICCVMPDELQPQAIDQFQRILKPHGRFRLVEIVYSKNKKLRRRQERLAKFVEKVYGARFDRNTLKYLQDCENLEIKNVSYLKDDTYLLIEGQCVREDSNYGNHNIKS